MKNILITLLLLITPMVLSAGVYSAEDVPMIHLQDKTRYVCNPDNILNSDSVYVMDTMLANLEATTGIEVLVVAVEQIADGDCYNFAFNIGQNNGVGKENKDNGLVIVLSTKDRCVQFVTGYGLEEFLPDAICYRIQNLKMNPFFKEQNWSAGMTIGVRSVCGILNGTMEAEYTSSDFSDFPSMIFIIVLLVVTFWLDWRSKKCPVCGKHALVMTGSKITKITSSYKERENTLKCKNCGHIEIRTERESRVASSSRGGYYGGGFGGSSHSGGHFGGGHFGGGGAGSRF
ncbi:MAG: TPM domain-containing protein [Paludibacteraceae bacterium]|nr:TPM domain-containing protein [Paludibacteraceae bacterium]